MVSKRTRESRRRFEKTKYPLNLVREHIDFKRGIGTKKSLGIGLEEQKERVLNKRIIEDKFVNTNDFNDDLIVYMFEKIYKDWLKKKQKDEQNKPTIDDIKIWIDQTSGGTPIIKQKVPGQRQSTMLIFEDTFYMNEIVDFLNTPEMKQKVLNKINDRKADLSTLRDMFWKGSRRMGVEWGDIIYSHKIAERLHELMKNN